MIARQMQQRWEQIHNEEAAEWSININESIGGHTNDFENWADGNQEYIW